MARNKPHVMPFLSAILKHGADVFDWEIIGDYPDRAWALAAERYFVDALKPEYNAAIGGICSSGALRSPQMAAIWKTHQHLGPITLRRPVICLEDGTIYESASEAARAYQTPKSGIIEVCAGYRQRRSVAGHHFQYVHPTNAEIVRYKIRDQARRRAKLSNDNVKAIRLLLLGSMKEREIALKFGVNKTTILDIRNGRSWKVTENVSA